MSARETAVCMGMDALRICIGQKPKTFTVEQVLRWITLMRTAQT